MFESQIDDASVAEPDVRQEIIRRLAAFPDETLHSITSGYQRTSRWPIILEIIRNIGPPRAVSTIPWVVEHVDRNAPAWHDIVQTLGTFPPDLVAPQLILKLWPPSEMRDEWGYDAESICALLTELDPPVATLCGPTVAYLLTLHIKPAILDPNYLLDVLETIGPSCGDYAVPPLLSWFSNSSDPEIVQRVQGFIDKLPVRAVEPYAVLMGAITNPPPNHS